VDIKLTHFSLSLSAYLGNPEKEFFKCFVGPAEWSTQPSVVWGPAEWGAQPSADWGPEKRGGSIWAVEAPAGH
jgi:hypothetical protein